MMTSTSRRFLTAGAAITIPGVGGAAAMDADAGAGPAWGPILRAVTTTAADLAAVQAAYERVLGYRVVEHGMVSAEDGQGLGARSAVAAPARSASCAPAAGQPTLLRLRRTGPARRLQADDHLRVERHGDHRPGLRCAGRAPGMARLFRMVKWGRRGTCSAASARHPGDAGDRAPANENALT